MVKKLISDPILARLVQIWAPKIFSYVLPLPDVRHCCKLSLYAISKKTNDPNSRKWQKTSFRAAEFFFKNLASSITRYHSYHHVQYQKKTILRKFSGGWMDRRTGRQTDDSDFIGRCPNNVERPIFWNTLK